MGHKNLIFFLINILHLIFLIRVIKSQNIELNCVKYASDVKCKVSHSIFYNHMVDIKKISSNTLKPKQLSDAPVLVLSREMQIESLPQKIGQHFKQLQELIVNLLGLKIVRRSDFSEMLSLKTLNLADNKLVEIPSDTFVDVKNLIILFINGNNIKKIEPDLLSGLRLLRAFNAQHNELQKLDDIFTENLLLESINLNDNKLSTINVNFTRFEKIKNIDLRNNLEICTNCTMRNKKALNRSYEICTADDDSEKKKHENQFKNCVTETLKTNTTFQDKLKDCTKDSSFVNCIMSRIGEISEGETFLNKCITSNKNAAASIKQNLETCLYCNNMIKDISFHAKICDLRYSEFSLYNISTFVVEVQGFFNKS